MLKEAQRNIPALRGRSEERVEALLRAVKHYATRLTMAGERELVTYVKAVKLEEVELSGNPETVDELETQLMEACGTRMHPRTLQKELQNCRQGDTRTLQQFLEEINQWYRRLVKREPQQQQAWDKLRGYALIYNSIPPIASRLQTMLPILELQGNANWARLVELARQVEVDTRTAAPLHHVDEKEKLMYASEHRSRSRDRNRDGGNNSGDNRRSKERYSSRDRGSNDRSGQYRSKERYGSRDRTFSDRSGQRGGSQSGDRSKQRGGSRDRERSPKQYDRNTTSGRKTPEVKWKDDETLQKLLKALEALTALVASQKEPASKNGVAASAPNPQTEA